MPNEISYRILYGISLIVSVVSFIGSSCIIWSWYQKKQTRQKNDILNDYVAYMSIADLIFIFEGIVFISNPTFKWQFVSEFPDLLCGIIGASYNFCAICTATWNFVIVTFLLLPMIRGHYQYEISKHKRYHFIFIFTICSICVILPFLTSNEGAYGLTDNGAEKYGLSKFQCFMINREDYICLYVFIIFYFIWSIVVLLYTIYIYKKDKTIQKLTSRLFWYSVAFIFVWSGAIFDRFYSQITGEISFILICYHWFSNHCIGWCNALVWYSYINFTPDTEHQKDYQSIRNENDNEMEMQNSLVV
eukprot:447456_1